MNQPKLILVIMDGWGYTKEKKGNAIYLAKLPTYNALLKKYPNTLLHAFGQNVGLPWGATGSSEVGHKSIGTGKKISQEYAQIDEKITSREFFDNRTILNFLQKSRKSGHPLHLIGMVSDGGVHSHTEHLFAILELLDKQKFGNPVYIHMITDGRDTDAKSAQNYAHKLENKIKSLKIDAKISTLCGRFLAMDRNSNWDRTKKAYDLITSGTGSTFKSADEALVSSYAKNLTDEFIEPVKIEMTKKAGLFSKLFKKEADGMAGLVKTGDSIFFFNLRADRMRQIVELFAKDAPEAGTKKIKKVEILTLTTYDDRLPVHIVYPTEKVKNPLAKIISDHHLTQAHFAETEKYAHVTYFFNGGNPEPFSGEEWFLTESPKVKTYDLQPEMSSNEITDKVLKAAGVKEYDFVLINYANADMVGHTGKLKATIEACQFIDKELKRLIENFPKSILLITADHGNADQMIDLILDEPCTTHSANPVPFILIDPEKPDRKLRTTGILADITPTVLDLLNLPIPTSFDGQDLIG